MAIAMPIQQDIRRYDRQGMPHARIARELGVHRGTVAKYAGQEDCSPQPKRDRRFGRKTDAYAALIDQMLEADRMMPRKQRHTARRIFDRLVAEHGFDGSYSVVRRYVKEWRETNRESSDGYLRLEWDPGVMQVDFGVALADVAGVERTVHFLVATLPYSNMRYAVAMPGENAECLCSGLSMVFERMGGVPSVLVMDNATGAGHRDRDGEVTLTHVFASFASHHRMEVRFCNPYSGNEKGNVENAVGFLRRNLMVPKPAAESFEQLTRLLLERCEAMSLTSSSPPRTPPRAWPTGSRPTGTRSCPCPRTRSTRCPGTTARPTNTAGSSSVRTTTRPAAAGSGAACWWRPAGTASRCTTRTTTP